MHVLGRLTFGTRLDHALVDLTLVRAIPEPSAALLFAAGIVGFATWNRRH